MKRSVEPALWLSVLLVSTLVGVWTWPLSFVAFFVWSALVWPLHRQRKIRREDWPPENGVELWQTSLGFGLVAALVFTGAWFVEHELLRILSVLVSLLASGVALFTAGFLTVFALVRRPHAET